MFDLHGKWCNKMWHNMKDREGVSARRVWHRNWKIVASLPTIAFLGLVLAVPHPAQARVFHCGAGDAVCLINAIDAANANGQQKHHSPGRGCLHAPDTK